VGCVRWIWSVMKIARLAVLGVALAAGGAAALLVGSGQQSNSPIVQMAPAPAPAIEMDDILVAAIEIPLGKQIVEADLAWRSWPKNSTGPGMVRKAEDPNVIDALKGSVARGAFFMGEPIRREKLVKSGNAGFLSAILPSGSRAVAINIDTQGGTSAGGFILPNDHVDIVRTYRDEAAAKSGSGDAFLSETVLRNVRILAIGQNIQEKNGQPVVVGSNATLEVDPRQAELIVLAQRTGQLSLVLRSMLDSATTSSDAIPLAQDDKSMTIVRFGVSSGERR
jgi:pilus assembly protein CpaB